MDTSFSKRKKKKLIEILTVYEFMRALVTHNINNSINPLKINLDFEVINSAYISFSSSIVNSSIEASIDQAIDNLKEILFSNLPSSGDFQILFTNLRHSDKVDRLLKLEKMLSTYAVFTLANWSDDMTRGTGALVERTTEDDEYSIEHIVPKSEAFDDDDTSNEYKIGNLMVLEKTINNNLGAIPVKDKISSYKESSYPQVKQFLYKTLRRTSKWGGVNTWVATEFDTQSINLRGEALAQEFYGHMIRVLKKIHT